MNEVKKCSISGVGFTLDAEAFEVLDNYLETLKKSYRENPDGDEIIADIEARIAELILTTQETARVVERPLVENIIRQLGSAEEITDHSLDDDLRHETPRIPRRLYRDIENARLGGVCSGIGRYFDIDPVWVRMTFFAPVLLAVFGQINFIMHWLSPLMGNLFGIFLICYFIMWFAVPAARTARQKLEMTGERITEQSIRETTAAGAAADPDSKARPIVAETVSVLGKVVLICLKLFAGFIVFGLILGACALIIGLFAVTIGGNEIFPDFLQEFSLWIPILGLIAVLIPVILLIYVIMCLIASRKPGGKTVLAVFLLWLATVVALSMLAVRDGLGSRHHKRIRIERIMDPDWHPAADDDQDDAQDDTEVDTQARRIRIGGSEGAIDISVDSQNGKLRLTAGDDTAGATVDVDAAQQSATIKIQKRDSAATQQ